MERGTIRESRETLTAQHSVLQLFIYFFYFNYLLISFIEVLINEHGKGNQRMSVDLVIIHSNCVNDIKSSIN